MFIDSSEISLIETLLTIASKKESGILYLSNQTCYDEQDILKDENNIKIFLESGSFATAYSEENNLLKIIDKLKLVSERKLNLIKAYNEEKIIETHLQGVYEFRQKDIKTIFKWQVVYFYSLLSSNFRYFYFEKQNSNNIPWQELTSYRGKIITLLKDFLEQQYLPSNWIELLPDKNISLQVINREQKFLFEEDKLLNDFYTLINPNLNLIQTAKCLKISLEQTQRIALFFKLIGLVRETYPEDALLKLTRRFLPVKTEISNFNLPVLNWKSCLIFLSYLIGGEFLIIFLLSSGFFQYWEFKTFDSFVRLRGTKNSQKVVLVTQTEEDLNFFKNYPITDAQFAQVLSNIQKNSPAAVGVDIYRNLLVPPGEDKLQQVYQTMPNLIGTYKQVDPKINPPSGLNKIGFADVVPDEDDVIRRNLLSVTDENEGVHLSLGLLMSLLYLEQKDISFSQQDDGTTVLGDLAIERLNNSSGFYWRGDTGGYQILLNTRYQLDDFPSLTWQQVYEDKIPPNFFQDKIVILGAIAPSLNDFFETSFTANKEDRTPGLVLHANAVENIVGAVLGEHPLLQVLSKKEELLIIVGWGIIGFLQGCIFLILNQRKPQPSVYFIFLFLGTVLSLFFINFSLFLQGLLLQFWVNLGSFTLPYCLTIFKFSSLVKALVYRDKIGFYNQQYFEYVYEQYLQAFYSDKVTFFVSEVIFSSSFLKEANLKKLYLDLTNLLGNRGYVFRYSHNKFLVLMENVTGKEIKNLKLYLEESLNISKEEISTTLSSVKVGLQFNTVSSLLLHLSKHRKDIKAT